MSDETPAPQLKHWFNEARYRSLAGMTRALDGKFDSKRFLKLTLEGLEERSLMQRLAQTAVAMNEALPGSYVSKLKTLQALAPQIDHGFITLFLSDFVAKYGLDDPKRSLPALKYFTRFGSAEFAIRHFLLRDLEATHAVMLAWADDADEHVRRLSSEGIRPRLPWGLRLQALVKNPEPIAPILEKLKRDPALYVRKSVANNLNDIAKDHPQWVVQRAEAWDRSHAETAWIIKHGCRTLIKKGHSGALKLFGFGGKPKVEATLTCTPKKLGLGEVLTITADIRSSARTTQSLAVDYVVHYVRPGGSSEKVFKWSEVELPASGSVSLKKNQTIKDFTTRKHYPGVHRVELQINGQRVAEAVFELLG